MNSIAEWLNSSRDYNTGVALFRCHADDALLLRMFEQGKSDFRAKRLEAELRELLRLADRVPVLEATPPVPAVFVYNINNNVVSETNNVVVPIPKTKQEKADPYKDQWTPLFQEMNALRHQLEDAPSDEARGVMAFRVLELERQCMKWWAKRDYLHRYGVEMIEESADEDLLTVDKNILFKRLTNIRSNISKTKKKLAKAPLNSELQQKLAAYEAERDRIEKAFKHE